MSESSSNESNHLKRSATGDGESQPIAKKRAATATASATGGTTLASYFTITPPTPPSQIASSAPYTDRRSTFVAHAAACTTQVGAAQFANHVKGLRTENHPREADHAMYAWRAVGLRPGKTGLGGEDDWTVKTGSEDDGEKGGGNTIKRAIEEAGGVDVVVVVSRYYGGIMLGQDRFRHIQLVTNQALEKLNEIQKLPELCTQLAALDARILELTIKPGQPVKLTSSATYMNDKTMTLLKAGRLLNARKKRVDFLEKHQAELEKVEQPQQTVPQERRSDEDDGSEDDWEKEAAEAFALAEAEESSKKRLSAGHQR